MNTDIYTVAKNPIVTVWKIDILWLRSDSANPYHNDHFCHPRRIQLNSSHRYKSIIHLGTHQASPRGSQGSYDKSIEM